MESKLKTMILGFRGQGLGILPPMMEHQMGKQMENEMDTRGPFKGVYRDVTPNNGESHGK